MVFEFTFLFGQIFSSFFLLNTEENEKTNKRRATLFYTSTITTNKMDDEILTQLSNDGRLHLTANSLFDM